MEDGGRVMEQTQYPIYTPPKHIVSAATIVINDQREILLIKGPRRGWEMPGGQETKEESGIEIEIIKFCGIFQNVTKSICNTLFLARPIGGKLSTSPESLEVGFFPIEQALDKVTWDNFRQRIEYCLDENFQPFLIEF